MAAEVKEGAAIPCGRPRWISLRPGRAAAAWARSCYARALALRALVVVVLLLQAAKVDSYGHGGAALLSLDDAPLHTEGRYIVNAAGEHMKWACLNWFGAYSEKHVVGGLEVRPVEEIVARVKELGFNCIRVCYSTEGHVENPLIAKEDVAGNPRFQIEGTRFLDVLDATIQAITDAGLMVIINNHNHKSGWCCHYTQDEGLWYTDAYSEEDWIWSLVNMTWRYKANKMVVAIDLRNELHDYEDTILTWGDGDPKTDWAAAATRAGNAVLAENNEVLIVVMSLCFGMELRPVRNAPIVLDTPSRVVYQTHNYMEYQVWGAISQSFASWLSIRIVSAIVLLITIPTAVVLLLVWRRLGKPMPPASTTIATLGSWWVVCCMIAVVICLVFYSILRNYCAYWARRDLIPSMITLAVLSLLGFAATAKGCHMHFGGCAAQEGLQFSVVAPSTVGASAGHLQPPEFAGEAKEPTTHRIGEAAAHNRGFCTPSWQSGQVAWARCVGELRMETDLPQIPWDRGLCCGLQCLCLCVVLGTLISLLFWFASIATGYRLVEWHFNNMWGFVMEEGHPYTAPVWMGEFGNNRRGVYWINFMRYLAQNNMDFAYWALNGKKWSEGWIDTQSGQWNSYPAPFWDSESYGIFQDDYKTVRSAWRLLDLQELADPPIMWPDLKPCNRAVLGNGCGG